MNEQLPTLRSAPSPDELVLRAQQGDRQAFSELVRAYHRGVVNVAYHIAGDERMAEDVAQEAFLRAWQNLYKYQPRASFRSWLYRIAANLALDELRSERETVDIDHPSWQTLSAAHSSHANPEEKLVSKQRTERVRQAVMALPTSSRMALVLREYEQLSYQEIADTLSIPLGTVMSRLSYARKCLLEVLSAELEVL